MSSNHIPFEPNEHPHRRYNPLMDEWVLVSPHRMKRPWQGQMEKIPPEKRPAYDPTCYLCPGNERAGGARNPHYEHTFVFDNDFPALLPLEVTPSSDQHPLLKMVPTRGTCRVICFSPRHDLAIPHMAVEDIRRVVDVWADQTVELGQSAYLQYVQIFENRGAMMGASNPHPHGQIWATEHIPVIADRETRTQADYFTAQGRPMLIDYLEQEEQTGTRIVCQNDHFVVVVPFWAIWPFETLVLPRRPVSNLPDLDSPERDALSEIIKRLVTRYDNLFETPFPYSMGWHQQPWDGQSHPSWILHAHFYPPLLRSATIRKFMVGFEMLGEAQRDLTAEQAAERLRNLPETLHNHKIE